MGWDVQKDNNQIRKQLSDKLRKCSRGKRSGSVRAAGVAKFAGLPKAVREGISNKVTLHRSIKKKNKRLSFGNKSYPDLRLGGLSGPNPKTLNLGLGT